MPISMDELVTELRECFRAGATGVHLHVRDRSGAETLDPSVVNDTCLHVREAAEEMGVPVEIGLTTGAWILPDLAARVAMIREWERVDCATVNLSEQGFEQVMSAMLDVGIGVDVGLSAPIEMNRCSGPVYCRGCSASASSWIQVSRTSFKASRLIWRSK